MHQVHIHHHQPNGSFSPPISPYFQAQCTCGWKGAECAFIMQAKDEKYDHLKENNEEYS